MARLHSLFLVALLASASTAFGAAGSWNGVSFTAWNGIGITSWDGTAISTVASFTPTTILYNAGAGWVTRTTAPVAVTDGGAFTLSMWVRYDSGDGSAAGLFVISANTGFNRLRVERTAANAIALHGATSGNTTILAATSSQTITAASGWTHVYVAVDLANASNRHVYFDGVEDASVTWTTYVNDSIDMNPSSTPRMSAGVRPDGSNRMSGGMCELWFNDAYFNDPTKFISGGLPISLGTTGNTPTGSAPALYLSRNGSGSSWVVDSSGNANDFGVVAGTVGSTTPP